MKYLLSFSIIAGSQKRLDKMNLTWRIIYRINNNKNILIISITSLYLERCPRVSMNPVMIKCVLEYGHRLKTDHSTLWFNCTRPFSLCPLYVYPRIQRCLTWTAKALIRPRTCAVWSETSLTSYALRYVCSLRGPYLFFSFLISDFPGQRLQVSWIQH